MHENQRQKLKTEFCLYLLHTLQGSESSPLLVLELHIIHEALEILFLKFLAVLHCIYEEVMGKLIG